MSCSLCHGQKAFRRWSRLEGWHSEPCGRCSGTGREPELSLRQLQAANQERLRRKRGGPMTQN